MKNDLISKSELLKQMKEFCGNQRYLISEEVWSMVENAPVSYNLSKVIKEIDDIMKDESIRFANQVVNASKRIVESGGIGDDD